MTRYFWCALLFIWPPLLQASRLPLETIELPKGFAIELYSGKVPNARQMALGDNGTLFVGSRELGVVYAITGDKDKTVYTLAENLTMPVGVAFKDGSLYVSAVNQILRYDNIEKHLKSPPKPVVVSNDFPKDTHHGWKFIAFGPDGKLYVPVGAPCNVCLKTDPRYASVMRMKPDGSELEVFAHGVRNTVGFDWHPVTKTLWFTDNGRDWLGDNLPPDELNAAPRANMHFGFPYCHGGNIADPEFGQLKPCQDFEPPKVNLGPHVAALGMRFYTGSRFPSHYHNKIFIAEHGSWNRSTPIGYRITYIDSDKTGDAQYQVFAKGWLQPSKIPFLDPKPWGRPVDVLVMPDGALLVSDDYAGAIYRIYWQG